MSTDSPAPRWLYHGVRWAVKAYLKLFHRFASEGEENVPRTGGCIVACNHVSYLDPPVVACGTRRRMFYFLARSTLWEHSRASHWFFSHYNCIPVDRGGGDVSALRRSIKVLKRGHALVLFPEGTRSPDGTLQDGEGGVGFVLARARVPIVPTLVTGSFEAFPSGQRRAVKGVQVRIRYGKAIQPDEIPGLSEKRPDYKRVSQFVMDRIAELAETGTSGDSRS